MGANDSATLSVPGKGAGVNWTNVFPKGFYLHMQFFNGSPWYAADQPGLFIRSMYNEFHKFAIEDSASGYDYGVKCLLKFYRYGLEEEFRGDLYNDFEQLTLDLYKKGNLYGLEQYRSFHQRRKVDGHSEPLKMNPELERLIGEEYRTLGDFQCDKVKEMMMMLIRTASATIF